MTNINKKHNKSNKNPLIKALDFEKASDFKDLDDINNNEIINDNKPQNSLLKLEPLNVNNKNKDIYDYNIEIDNFDNNTDKKVNNKLSEVKNESTLK